MAVDLDSDDLDDEDGGDTGGNAGPSNFTAGDGEGGLRLDVFLAARHPDLSRTRIKNLILEQAVTIDGRPAKGASQKIIAGQTACVDIPPAVPDTPEPENIPLDIVYEDADLLVINKQAGLVVHPGAGNYTGTLVNALLYHCGDSLSGIGGVKRPGIVHRLDKDTSGLMLAAKSDRAHHALAAQLADRTLSRRYRAFVWGVPRLKKGAVDAAIARHTRNRLKMTVVPEKQARAGKGKAAKTYYTVEENFYGEMALLDLKLDSGRTHQIRVHMEMLGHPLIGDPLYGAQKTAMQAALKRAGFMVEGDAAQGILDFPRQALHAWKIGFVHPVSEEEMTFESAFPADLEDLRQKIISI